MRNRQQAQLIAEQILKEDIVILDTETTGLKSDDEIIEISIINADGNVLLDTLIKPQKKIPPDATRIHRITNEDVQHKPLWSDVYKKYREIVKGKTVVIYNKSYDTKIIRQTCKKYELPTPRIKSECAMLLYAKYEGIINKRTGEYKWHKLTDAIYKNNIQVTGEAHRALTDARMTLELLKFMACAEVNVSPRVHMNDSVHYTKNKPSNSIQPIKKKSNFQKIILKFLVVVIFFLMLNMIWPLF
ncbi:3'-5' exonuclease [Xenorhabdus bovienii]|uniref:3'-5' exonuclease n=1 Tax=Xenorhabdus bovienii TaxID=40576 RepID=UPI0023B34A01|nr:3'-5' exonuclease [Xenorhabdus bovienii]MDE9429649.1 3'-5' exonuclease [Xenorhabdus bovienii]MDE9570036.1 3'-5' exonuclease [Xenorhabdus bovienii]